jgi:hypothetical protein
MNASEYVDALARIHFDGVFNPYSEVCQLYDLPQAPAIRRSNLKLYLSDVLARGVDEVWLGRDCGYRGARRTGIALTDEMNLHRLEQHLETTGFEKATIGPPMRERTATVVWDILGLAQRRVFLWNVFPFHPFDGESAMSNRPHSAKEFGACKDLVQLLLQELKPKVIVAIGGDARKALQGMGFQVEAIRHPSYGGHNDFLRGIRRLHNTDHACISGSAVLPHLEL